MDNTHVSGLLLFSPGFYPRNFLLRFSPLFSFFSDWIDIDEEDNIFCYQSLHVNASLLYYTSVKKLQKKIHARVFDKPALIVISQHDSVINTDNVVKLFHSKFTNKSSRLIWYGTKLDHKDKRIELYNSRIPHKKISTFSHMNILFSNTNEYFGENGKHLMLENGQKNIPVPSDRSELWFGAWGYTEKDKFHARLTWNPYLRNSLMKSTKLLTISFTEAINEKKQTGFSNRR
ncbi:MAG: hypothetical protein LRY51_05345 [Geovibrio sp.]|nr:hypothetical protein [Geovibrio sp.]